MYSDNDKKKKKTDTYNIDYNAYGPAVGSCGRRN